jgi:hypothetical protein
MPGAAQSVISLIVSKKEKDVGALHALNMAPDEARKSFIAGVI